MLVTAVAATVVIVSWVLNRPAHSAHERPPAQDTQLVEQPLIGLGGGVTVRELTQDTPFSLVALTGDLTGTSTRVRAKRPDGSWGPWYQAEYETAAPDAPGSSSANPGEGPRSTDPVFVGTTTTVQVAVTRPVDAPVTQPPVAAETNPAGLGYRPATKEQPFGQNISAILISPPRAPARTQWTPPTGVTMPGQAPPIISRAEWGADESLRCGSPQYDRAVRAAVVHHTAGSNDYSPLESAGIVKAIYTYHSKTLGWCDIAYNALVDKYGQVFEGSAGGLTKPVEAFHTGGFNRDTWGVAMIGNFDDVAPTPLQLRAVGRLLGWRLGMDDVDPKGTVELESAGSSYTTYPAGAIARLPAIFTHRDVGNTDCPGNAGYALMDEIRDIAAHFNDPPEELLKALEGGVIYERWQALGGDEQRTGRTHLARGRGGRCGAVRNFRQGSDVLVTRNRRATGHRRDLRRLGFAELRTRAAWPADQRRDPRTAANHAELPAWGVELRTAHRQYHRGCRRNHDAAVDSAPERPRGPSRTLLAANASSELRSG